MPSQIESLLRRARRADRDALAQLAFRVSSDKTFVIQLNDVLFDHLQVQCPAPPFSDQDTRLVSLIKSCITIFNQAINGCPNHIMDHSALQVARHWENIRCWTVFLTKEAENDPAPYNAQSEAFAIVNSTVLGINRIFWHAMRASNSNAVRRKILGCQGLPGILFRTWIVLMRHCRDAPMVTFGPLAAISHSLRCLSHREIDGQLVVDDILGQMNDIPDWLDIVRSMMRFAVRKNALAEWGFASTVIHEVITSLECKVQSAPTLTTLRRACFSDEMLPLLIKLIRARARENFEDVDMKCLSNCLSSLKTSVSLDYAGPPVILIAAIRTGLMPALGVLSDYLSCTDHQQSPELSRLLVELLEMVIKSTTHARILRAVVVAGYFKPVDLMNDAEHVKHLRAVWQKFEIVVKHRMRLRSEYKQSKRELCHNTTCPSPFIKLRLVKMCTWCYTLSYCSRRCQKEDWKRRHAQQCEQYAASVQARPVGRLDYDFLVWMTYKGFLSVKDCVLEAVKETGKTVCMMDYSSHPPGWTLQTVEELLQQHQNGPEFLSEARIWVQHWREDDVLVYSNVPVGHTSLHTFRWSGWGPYQ